MSAIAETTRMRSSYVIDESLRSEPLENHLVRPAFRALAVLRRAHRPGEQRQAENIACNPRARGGQIVHVIRDKMRPRARRMQQECKLAPLSRSQRAPLIIFGVALRHDAAGK